jgi:hypothetical protein
MSSGAERDWGAGAAIAAVPGSITSRDNKVKEDGNMLELASSRVQFDEFL